ncbi:hypothetical protein OHA40_31250 [Nocardia sp. NBC_00508]|uniref:hypothetical protein n=1 Tax=Nocardia sp. NBC_00508 TaxID=2975992 RepID=UPI002E81C4BF|nr:hypothetical protein [Nocardia sp. NBC_00508]WUD70213.1 hypothetical protein OHA40_31250 [Nocardia sp. NBC_00508]
MAIVEVSHSPEPPFVGRCASFHDTIVPSPDEGTHSSVADRHSGHVVVSGASNFAQSMQRRIIMLV